MGLYFFHVTDGETTLSDEIGTDCSTVEEAKALAKTIAAELGMDLENYRGYAVCVVDNQGDKIVTVQIADLL
jgi:hypothetical protein